MLGRFMWIEVLVLEVIAGKCNKFQVRLITAIYV